MFFDSLLKSIKISKLLGISYIYIYIYDMLNGSFLSLQLRQYKLMKLNQSQTVKSLEYLYYCMTGSKVEIKNAKSFNEKIQLYKLFINKPIYTLCADKEQVRNYVFQKIGVKYLIPLIGSYDKSEEIDFAALPERFVIKCNHGSGFNIVVSNKEKLDINATRIKLDTWLSLNYAYSSSFEMQYKNIRPRILIEKYLVANLSDNDTNHIVDYRFYCFDGIVKQIWVDKYSGTPNHVREIFDVDWNRLPVVCRWPLPKYITQKPDKLDEMLNVAVTLSTGFPFVRVDLYFVNNCIYFGELTFTPMSGYGKYNDPKYDLELGSYFNLPISANVS